MAEYQSPYAYDCQSYTGNTQNLCEQAFSADSYQSKQCVYNNLPSTQLQQCFTNVVNNSYSNNSYSSSPDYTLSASNYGGVNTNNNNSYGSNDVGYNTFYNNNYTDSLTYTGNYGYSSNPNYSSNYVSGVGYYQSNNNTFTDGVGYNTQYTNNNSSYNDTSSNYGGVDSSQSQLQPPFTQQCNVYTGNAQALCEQAVSANPQLAQNCLNANLSNIDVQRCFSAATEPSDVSYANNLSY